jgi:hypothetical protein
MSEHTPGPWVGLSDDGALVAIMPAAREGDICSFMVSPNDADGRLIVASPDMLAALRNVNKLISEAAMTGFNCKDGDWAERLFTSQQVTSAAIRKALGS